ALLRAAAARGHETVTDIYPYLAGQTGLGSLFVPAWAVEGGRAEMLRRFQDPALRPRIVREIEAAIKARILTPDNIYVSSHQRNFSEYMREMNAGAGETMLRMLEKESPMVIMKFGAEPDLVELLQFPGSAVSCDCGATETRPGLHPRYFGTFPRVLGHYVRETKALTPEDAVRKMTGLPASIAGMVDRGFLATGMAADIAVFDPVTIIDQATYEQPTLVSKGVRHVLVNGQLALREGQATGAQGGRVLRREGNMPSRPMRLGRPRTVSVKTSAITLNLSQSANGRARGVFRFVNTRRVEYRMVEAGLLQTHGQWATFTARMRVGPDAEERFVQVILDVANPLNPRPAISIKIAGDDALSYTADPGRYNITAR
ncbi:MAG: amidohydrolase family protein, partial [Blastocatellia bacterium]